MDSLFFLLEASLTPELAACCGLLCQPRQAPTALTNYSFAVSSATRQMQHRRRSHRTPRLSQRKLLQASKASQPVPPTVSASESLEGSEKGSVPFRAAGLPPVHLTEDPVLTT